MNIGKHLQKAQELVQEADELEKIIANNRLPSEELFKVLVEMAKITRKIEEIRKAVILQSEEAESVKLR